MKILFVYSSLPIGGIETFIVRLSKNLHQNSFEVLVLFFVKNYDQKLMNELKKYATIYFWDDIVCVPKILKNLPPIIRLFFPIRLKSNNLNFMDGVSHIHAPDINSILFSNRLLNAINNFNIPLTTGIYHINEFNLNNCSKFYFGKILIKIINTIPYKNIIFFNDICKKSYKSTFQKEFTNSKVCPIGVDTIKYEGTYSGCQNNKVVSIGRLTKWKTYHYHIIKVIRTLKEKGIYLEYHSYGTGEELKNLINYVDENDLEKQVFFNENIQYDLFKETIDGSLMFIGAGTALIEASACGIPSLIGIENESEAVSYGFLHNTTSLSYQENELTLPKYPIENYILHLMNTNHDEYLQECTKARIRSQDFSMQSTYSKFINFLNESISWNLNLSYLNSFYFFISLCFYWIYENLIIKSDKNYFTRL